MANKAAQPVQLIWLADSGQAYNIAFDAVTNETHGATSTITDHPVEVGANISDHIRPDADTVNLTGVVSNTPILLPGDHVDGAERVDIKVQGRAKTVRVPIPGVGALIGAIEVGQEPQGTVLGFSPGFDRVAAVYAELLDCRAKGRLFRVITTLRTYENMGMQSLTVTRDANSGNALNFVIDFKEVFIGSTEDVPVPEISRKTKDKGSQTPEPKEPEEEERASATWNLLNGR